MVPNHNLGVHRRFIRRINSRESLNHARARLLVQSLGITLLRDLNRDVDVDLNEWDASLVVELASGSAVGDVGRDEGSDRDAARVCEKLRDFANAADVFVAVCFGEAEVFVEAEADVVACGGGC